MSNHSVEERGEDSRQVPCVLSCSHLPALPHIHKQSLQLQEFFCPLPGLWLKKGGLTQTRGVSLRGLHHFSCELTALSYHKIGLVQRRSTCCSCTHTAVTAGLLISSLRPLWTDTINHHSSGEGLFLSSEFLGPGTAGSALCRICSRSCCCWSRNKQLSQFAPGWHHSRILALTTSQAVSSGAHLVTSLLSGTV